MGNKQTRRVAEEAQGKYVRSLVDDLRQQVDQLNVEKGQLSERTNRLRGERDVLLEDKGTLHQRVEQLEERIRHYKRNEHKLLEENKQLQLEGDEDKLKELSLVYQKLQRVGQLTQKLNKQVQQGSKQRPQEAQLVQQLQEAVEGIQTEMLVHCGVESEKMEKLAMASQNSPSTPTDTSEVAATGQHQYPWWSSSPPPPPPPHPARKAPPPPSHRVYPYLPASLPLRRQLHSQPPLPVHPSRPFAMSLLQHGCLHRQSAVTHPSAGQRVPSRGSSLTGTPGALW